MRALPSNEDPPEAVSQPPGNAPGPRRQREMVPLLTAHIHTIEFGADEHGALYAELGYDVRGKTERGLLPLAGLTPSSRVSTA
jgi:hypothetical protein